MHAKIENGKVIEVIDNIRQYCKEISLPVDITQDELLPDGFVYINPSLAPEYNSNTQKLIQDLPVFNNGKWVAGYKIADLSNSEKDAFYQNAAVSVRAQRDLLISQTDWTQGKDIDDSISLLWVDYRQALRDVTAQEGFPFNVTWPELPSTL